MGRRPPFIFGYNTSGFAYHRLEDALRILRRLGYRGAALTLDVHHLDPWRTSRPEVARVGSLCERLGLRVVVETGARYLLDPWRKHEPGLLSRRGWRRRLEFLEQALAVAVRLGAGVVSFWSGRSPAGLGRRAGMALLAERCGPLARAAGRLGLRLGLEPEPGMFLARVRDFERFRSFVGEAALGLTLDLGHCHCLGETPVEAVIQRTAPHLVHVHAEDMVRGRHLHLPFGRGEMDYRPLLATLARAGYRGMVAVELPREAHDAVTTAREALAYLRRCVAQDWR